MVSGVMVDSIILSREMLMGQFLVLARIGTSGQRVKWVGVGVGKES